MIVKNHSNIGNAVLLLTCMYVKFFKSVEFQSCAFPARNETEAFCVTFPPNSAVETASFYD
jgi:hypothetical protein